MAASAASTEVQTHRAAVSHHAFPHSCIYASQPSVGSGFSSPVYQYPRKPGSFSGILPGRHSIFHRRPDILRRLARNVSYQLIRLADGITGIFRGSLCQVHMAVAMGFQSDARLPTSVLPAPHFGIFSPTRKKEAFTPSPWVPPAAVSYRQHAARRQT